jgi:hypothetical protein
VAKTREPVNPFYALLVVLGVAFLITACAYYVMAIRALRPAAGGAPVAAEAHPLTDFVDRHGIEIMGWELALLAAATFAAMWLDRFRAVRRPAGRVDDSIEPRQDPPAGQTSD